MATEDVARHELRRGHVFQRGFGEDFAGHLCLSQLQQEAVLEHRVHLKGVTQTHLLLGQTCHEGELLVDEVRSQHRVGSLDSVGGGQIVVLTRVDDDAGKAIDDAAHVLVDERALHVDVAEENAVEGIVQHHIQTFEGAHDGDFGHTQT